jgi:hypothetical protein
MVHTSVQSRGDGAGRLAGEIRRDYTELRCELGRLDEALRELDVREDLTSVVEFVLRFEKRVRHLRVLAAELSGFLELTGDLRALIALAREHDPAVRGALRLAARRFRVAMACHACHADRLAAVPTAATQGA